MMQYLYISIAVAEILVSNACNYILVSLPTGRAFFLILGR